MLEAVPKGLFSKDYSIVSNTGELLVELHRDWFRKEGRVTIEGVMYRVYREGYEHFVKYSARDRVNALFEKSLLGEVERGKVYG